MGTVLQCRKFDFFDVNTEVDDGKISESLKDTNIVSIISGRGTIFFGDTKGWVHILNRHFEVAPFVAHGSPVKVIHTVDNSNLIVTAGTTTNHLPEFKIWCMDRQNPQGPPTCLRTVQPDPTAAQAGSSKSASASHGKKTPPTITAICVHPNNSLMAVGLSDGSLMLYRGELRRERGGIKARLLTTFSTGSVTNLHFRHQQSMSHLFVTTLNAVYCINCTPKDKEKMVELDTAGCIAGCSALTDSRHDHQLLVARNDAIYSYTVDSRGSCYVFEGNKVFLCVFKGYIVVASQQDPLMYSSASTPVDLTIYDPVNKLITLSTVIEDLTGVVSEWGSLYVVTSHNTLIHLMERDLHSKFDLLFKKNQFDIAVNLAKMQCCDQEEVTEILKQYGDWHYGKTNYSAAMDQYIKTIPLLEPSYVIKKFLDTQHINQLTRYLQSLHKMGHATTDHITLILNCYTRLRDSEQLDDFITNIKGEIDCDVRLGIKVCRNAGYFDHALALASKNKLHNLYLSILIEDKKDYSKALRYICSLPFEDACENVSRYGAALLSHVAEETTNLLVELCTDYKPSNDPLIKDERPLDSYGQPASPLHANPEDFEYLFVGHSEAAVSFLEQVLAVKPLSPDLQTTLLGELLFQFSQAPEGQDQSAIAEKVLSMIRNDEIKLDKDHALLLCDKYQCHAAKLVLWEQAGMFQELLAWHAENRDYGSIVEVCSEHAHLHPHLWGSALRLVVAEKSPLVDNSQFLNKILHKIEESQLLPPMELVDLLASSPHVTLGQVREFLLRVVADQSAALSTESSAILQQHQEASRMKTDISALTKGSREFTGTKCNVCNNNLNLPSIHFLCRHSFHLHCFDSYAGSESDCPLCSTENRKLRDVLIAQSKNANRHELLQEQLERNPDTFSIVADFVGRGAFTQFDNLQNLNHSYHRTKVSEADRGKLAFEDRILGFPDSASEARLRLHESRSQGILTSESEGRLRQLGRREPSPLDKASEGRIRHQVREKSPFDMATEGRLRQQQARKEPNPAERTSEGRLRAAVAAAPSEIVTSPTEGRLRVSAQRDTPAVVKKSSPKFLSSSLGATAPSPFSTKSADLHTISSSIENSAATIRDAGPHGAENPFETEADTSNPFGMDFETEEISNNPFEEDYDHTKNPFADSEAVKDSLKGADSNHRTDQSESSNPFDTDYDPKLNPFEDL